MATWLGRVERKFGFMPGLFSQNFALYQKVGVEFDRLLCIFLILPHP